MDHSCDYDFDMEIKIASLVTGSMGGDIFLFLSFLSLFLLLTFSGNKIPVKALVNALYLVKLKLAKLKFLKCLSLSGFCFKICQVPNSTLMF